MAREVRKKPRETAAAPWPTAPASDPAAEVVRRLVLNVNAARGDKSLRAVASAAGISHGTLVPIMNGERWPDAETIAKLERGLGEDLWPGLVED